MVLLLSLTVACLATILHRVTRRLAQASDFSPIFSRPLGTTWQHFAVRATALGERDRWSSSTGLLLGDARLITIPTVVVYHGSSLSRTVLAINLGPAPTPSSAQGWAITFPCLEVLCPFIDLARHAHLPVGHASRAPCSP